jgi:hypothetical protein
MDEREHVYDFVFVRFSQSSLLPAAAKSIAAIISQNPCRQCRCHRMIT